MSDPLERLRPRSFDDTPDIDAIRVRAHRIQRRRQVGVASAGVSALAIIAVVGVLLTTGSNDKPTQLATEARTTPTPLAYGSVPQAGVTVEESESAGKTSAGKSVGGGAAVSAPTDEKRSSSDSAALERAQAGRVEELKATLEIEDQTIGRGKTFTLKVCNQTSGTVKRSFGSSQRYDFEVKQEGDLVWRWSDGQFFTQEVGEETWKAKECKKWAETWDATNSEGMPVASGDYEAVGMMKASPELRTSPTKFSVGTL